MRGRSVRGGNDGGKKPNEAQPQTIQRLRVTGSLSLPQQGGGERLVRTVRCADRWKPDESQSIRGAKLLLAAASLSRSFPAYQNRGAVLF